MSYRQPSGPEDRALTDRYVIWSPEPIDARRYMRLLNPLHEAEPDHHAFERALAEDAREIKDADLSTLLEFEWRSRFTAAWLIGLHHRTQFRDVLGELLLASELAYAGIGYCFAFARFARPDDADILAAYLHRYLPRTDCHYNQDSAIGALLYIDSRLGTSYSGRFLDLWRDSAFADRDPFKCKRHTVAFCDYADRVMNAEP